MYRWPTTAAMRSAALVIVLPLVPPIATASTPDDAAVAPAVTLAPATARPANAATDASIPGDAVLALLAESGIEHSLEGLLATVREAGAGGARQGAGDASDADARVADVTDALDGAFALERMRPIVVRHVAAAVADGDVGTLLAHHRSDLGRRLQAAVRERQPSLDPEGYARFIEAFGSRPGDAERLALLEHYVRESGAAELVARFVIEAQMTSLHAVLALVGERARPFFDARVAGALADLDPMIDAMAERLPAMLAYCYDGFSMDELHAMTAMELSEAGRRVTAAVFDGFREVTVAGNAEFARRVRAILSFAGLHDAI